MALKILFSPSESKISLNTNNKFNGKDLIFPELFDKRVEILNRFGNNKVVFNHISEDVFEEIIENKLKMVIENIKKRINFFIKYFSCLNIMKLINNLLNLNFLN